MGDKIQDKRSVGSYFKDFLILSILFALIINNLCIFLAEQPRDFNFFIQQNLLTFIGYVGLLKIFELFGWYILVPDFYLNREMLKHQYELDTFMELYCKNEIKFIEEYDKQRMNYVISQLGLSINQLDKVRLDIIKLRMKELKNIKDAKEKIKSIIKCDYAVINLEDFFNADVTYREVNNYINFMDLMYINSFSTEIIAAMVLFISEHMPPQKYDKIVIPHDGNLLLGFELGKRLSKPVVKIREKEGKILRDQKWDGVLESTDRIIIIHDVLVSGAQIMNAIHNIPATCERIGFFCLVNRKEWKGKRNDLEKEIPIYSMLELDDKDIVKLKGEDF